MCVDLWNRCEINKKATNSPVELANIECGIECRTGPTVGLFSILVAILHTMLVVLRNCEIFQKFFLVRMVVFGM